jgi:hypothetical protein
MGLFNSFSKLTQKVISKFKNTGYDKKPIQVPTATIALKKGVSETVIKRGRFKGYKLRKARSNRSFRAEGNFMIKYNFGTFSPVPALPGFEYLRKKKDKNDSVLNKVYRVLFPKPTAYLNKTERQKVQIKKEIERKKLAAELKIKRVA